MKASDPFKTAIGDYLKSRAVEDPLFAANLEKKNKSIEECCNYIMSEVKKRGVNVMTNEEVFSMAVHYYDEDDIKCSANVKCKVVVSKDNPERNTRNASPTTAKTKGNKKQQIFDQPSLF